MQVQTMWYKSILPYLDYISRKIIDRLSHCAGMTGMLCPCVLFGRNVEKFKEEIPWTNACICHAICIEGGLTLAALMAVFNGYFEPNTLHLCGEGLLFGWWICAIYNGLFREELQKKYHLQVIHLLN